MIWPVERDKTTALLVLLLAGGCFREREYVVEEAAVQLLHGRRGPFSIAARRLVDDGDRDGRTTCSHNVDRGTCGLALEGHGVEVEEPIAAHPEVRRVRAVTRGEGVEATVSIIALSCLVNLVAGLVLVAFDRAMPGPQGCGLHPGCDPVPAPDILGDSGYATLAVGGGVLLGMLIARLVLSAHPSSEDVPRTQTHVVGRAPSVDTALALLAAPPSESPPRKLVARAPISDDDWRTARGQAVRITAADRRQLEGWLLRARSGLVTVVSFGDRAVIEVRMSDVRLLEVIDPPN